MNNHSGTNKKWEKINHYKMKSKVARVEIDEFSKMVKNCVTGGSVN